VPESHKPTRTLFSHGGILIETDASGLVAYLSFKPSGSAPTLREDALREALRQAGVVFGIDEKALSAAAGVSKELKRYVIARGKEPQAGKPPRLDYKFPIDPYARVGVKTQSGRIDFREKGGLPYVKPGDELAILIPGTDPIPGRKVTGEEIKASVEIASGVEPGARVELQGERYIAMVAGGARLDEQGRIEVTEVWIIDRDVDIHTGNIHFAGPVKIRGLVNSGFVVDAKSVFCEGVEQKALVKAETDVVVDGGILGGTVTAGGNVSARFLNNAKVTCVGDVEVKLSMINSQVNSSGKIKAQTVIGGTAASLKGLECVNLSSEASHSTVIFGIDPIKQQQIKELAEKKVSIEGQISQLKDELAPVFECREAIEKVKRKIKNMNTERSALAQRKAKLSPDDVDAREFFDGRLGELDAALENLEQERREHSSTLSSLGAESIRPHCRAWGTFRLKKSN